MFFSIFRCLTAKEKKHNQISINVHIGDASGMDFFVSADTKKHNNYLLVMTDTLKITDHLKFFYSEKKFLTCSLCTPEGKTAYM